jgi:Zn-dependent protease
MVLITFSEVIKLLVVSFILGFIFMGLFPRRPRTVYDMMHPKKFRWDDLWFAVLIAAPAVVLHELAHKFVAMGFGFSASFELFPLGLGLGLLLRLINSPFLIIAPGYVTMPPEVFSNDLAYRLIAFAGPFLNLILWLAAFIIIKVKGKDMSRGTLSFWLLTRNINMILFIFNMIPFGPFDGAKVFFGVG